MTTQNERLAVVETQVTELRKAFEDHKEHTNEEFDKVNNKLDDLLEIKHKSMGAFWLAATVIGSGIIGLISFIINYIKGT